MDLFDPQDLSLPVNRFKQSLDNKKPPRHKPGEKFLRGPIPWDWLCRAAHQPGKALHVAIAIWFLAGIKDNRKLVLSNAVPRMLGVNRHAKSRGLKALERAGLVVVERQRGRSPLVTILDAV